MNLISISFDKNGHPDKSVYPGLVKSNALVNTLVMTFPKSLYKLENASKEETTPRVSIYVKRIDGLIFNYSPQDAGSDIVVDEEHEEVTVKILLDHQVTDIGGDLIATLSLFSKYDSITSTDEDSTVIEGQVDAIYNFLPFTLTIDDSVYTASPDTIAGEVDSFSQYDQRLQNVEIRASALTTAVSSIELNTTRLENAEASIATNQSDIVYVRSITDTHTTDLNMLKSQTGQMSTRLGALETTSATHGSDISDIKTYVGMENGNAFNLNNRITSLETDSGEQESRLITVENRIHTLLNNAPEALDTLKEIADKLEDNDNDITEALLSVADNSSRLDMLVDDIGSLDNRESVSEGKISTLEGKVATNETSIETITPIVASHTADISNLQIQTGQISSRLEEFDLPNLEGRSGRPIFFYDTNITLNNSAQSLAIDLYDENVFVPHIQVEPGDLVVTKNGYLLQTIEADYESLQMGQFNVLSCFKGEQGIPGIQGEIGPTGNGISSMSLVSLNDSGNTYRIQFTNGSSYDFSAPKGPQGPQGPQGIEGISMYKSSASNPGTASGTTYTVDSSTVTVPSGRTIKVGDFLVITSYRLFTITAISGTTLSIQYVGSIRGSSGASGSNGNDGAEGLSIWYSTTSTSTTTTSITLSTITIPTGRSVKVGDLIMANSTYSYLYRVTDVSSTTATVTYLMSMRGATGSSASVSTTSSVTSGSSTVITSGGVYSAISNLAKNTVYWSTIPGTSEATSSNTIFVSDTYTGTEQLCIRVGKYKCSGTNQTISFGITYKYAPWVMVMIDSATSNVYSNRVQITGQTTTGFTIAGSSSAFTIRWIAIGTR